MLVLSSWRLQFGLRSGTLGLYGSSIKDTVSFLGTCPFMKAAKVLKKLAMLDVAIAGTFLVTYCMAIYKDVGVFVRTAHGIWFLLAAEFVHSLVFFVVSSVADYPAKQVAWSLSDDDSLSEPEEQRGGGLPLCCADRGYLSPVCSPNGSPRASSKFGFAGWSFSRMSAARRAE